MKVSEILESITRHGVIELIELIEIITEFIKNEDILLEKNTIYL